MEIIIDTIPPVTAKFPGRLLSIGTIRAGMSPAAENANCTVSLDNGDGHFSDLFVTAPLGFYVTVQDAAEVVFAGVITEVKLGSTCELSLEA